MIGENFYAYREKFIIINENELTKPPNLWLEQTLENPMSEMYNSRVIKDFNFPTSLT